MRYHNTPGLQDPLKEGTGILFKLLAHLKVLDLSCLLILQLLLSFLENKITDSGLHIKDHSLKYNNWFQAELYILTLPNLTYIPEVCASVFIFLPSRLFSSSNGPGEHYAKWNKPGSERQITYDLTYKWNLINETNKWAQNNQRH